MRCGAVRQGEAQAPARPRLARLAEEGAGGREGEGGALAAAGLEDEDSDAGEAVRALYTRTLNPWQCRSDVG